MTDEAIAEAERKLVKTSLFLMKVGMVRDFCILIAIGFFIWMTFNKQVTFQMFVDDKDDSCQADCE